jgi:hypothetical protein
MAVAGPSSTDGRCMTAIRCRAGVMAQSHCSATRPTRCCRSWPRAPARRSRTPPCSQPAFSACPTRFGPLRHYEDLRGERTARVQLAARHNETVFHLSDGPDQLERDRRLAETSGEHTVHRNRWVFGYDVDQVMATHPAPHDEASTSEG